jgi:hypothetical protein
MATHNAGVTRGYYYQIAGLKSPMEFEYIIRRDIFETRYQEDLRTDGFDAFEAIEGISRKPLEIIYEDFSQLSNTRAYRNAGTRITDEAPSSANDVVISVK